MNLLDVVAVLVQENGQRWGDAATDEQISDMRAFAEEYGRTTSAHELAATRRRGISPACASG